MTTKKLFQDLADLAGFDASKRPPQSFLAGVDEAGRGPLAGPVVAAAVILDPEADYPGVNDSKKMSATARETAYELITSRALSWAWAEMSAKEVDDFNPLRAALMAMSKAVAGLSLKPGFVLVDGNARPDLETPLETVVKGDARSLSIAAASIVAKVTRDRLMIKLHEKFPKYGFDRHKGYGTAAHLAALRRYGPSVCHRLTFRGVLPPAETQTAFRWLNEPPHG